LPVSPIWKPDEYTQLRPPPASEHSAGHRETDRRLAAMAGRGPATRSTSDMRGTTTTPSSDVSPGSIRSSASTGTVKWAGGDNGEAKEGYGRGSRID
jgi:hypothetical protein